MSRPTKRWIAILGLWVVGMGLGSAVAQQPPPPDDMGPPPMEGRRPPMERAFHLGPRGRWWNNPEFAQKIGLTPDQQKKMETVFEQNRPGLLDLSGSVRKEEETMAPLLAADQPDEAKILAQIDRIAQARAELEKSNARMLLGLRRILTPDQWKTLQAMDPHGDPRSRHSRFGDKPGEGPPGGGNNP